MEEKEEEGASDHNAHDADEKDQHNLEYSSSRKDVVDLLDVLFDPWIGGFVYPRSDCGIVPSSGGGESPDKGRADYFQEPYETDVSLPCGPLWVRNVDKPQPSNLPSLRILALHSIHLSPSALASIAPQIQILSVLSQEIYDPARRHDWSSLKAYSQGWGMSLRPTLNVLNTKIKYLRIEQAQEDLDAEVENLANGVEMRESWAVNLKEVWLEPLDSLIYKDDSDPIRFARNVNRLRIAGVVVHTREDGGLESWIKEVQKLLSTSHFG
ncbi:hypothetical protein P7C70_g8061, partial [Phenoliferia sp. Uapishka_3]